MVRSLVRYLSDKLSLVVAELISRRQKRLCTEKISSIDGEHKLVIGLAGAQLQASARVRAM
jgi:hypothetical protein